MTKAKAVAWTNPEEERRELLTRDYTCPACHQPAGARCLNDVNGRFSCVARYDLAAADGLVPTLGGPR